MRNGRPKNRILMVVPNNSFPQDERVHKEARSLVEAGFQVTVISPRGRNQSARDTWQGVKVLRFRKRYDPKKAGGYLYEVLHATFASMLLSLRVAFTSGFDVIHAHNPPDTLVLVAAVYKPFGKKFVFDHHDLAPEMYSALFGKREKRYIRAGLVFFEKLTCRLADHVIATNESYKELEVQRGRVDPEHVTIVRNGPDPDRIHPVEADPELRRRAGTLIGFVGLMGRQDGVDHLVRAVHHLVHDLGRTDTLAVVVGQGVALDDLRALARELRVEEHVLFTGWLPDDQMLRYMSTVDVCVVPDPLNPFTNRSTMIKMMEYMTLGKPIVAFDLREHRVTAGDAAVYVTPNDDLELARAIDTLMEQPEQRRAMGELGQRRVRDQLAWEHSVPALVSAYRTVLAG
jgi:glycosyltransferase involved in cell wall biosynthesis